MRLIALEPELVRYIVERGYKPGDLLPTLSEISGDLYISVAKAREQLEVARTLGLVEVKPGSRMRVEPFSFAPVARLSALYAVGQDVSAFEALSQTRIALEVSFWEQAVSLLEPGDIARLRGLIAAARERLSRVPIQVPYSEHRQFHLTIFSRLENPFVTGILEAYWDAHEAFSPNLYAELSYHRSMWDHHQEMVDAIEEGDIEGGRKVLADHMKLLRYPEAPAVMGD
jgi:DNA-binding FadR family transcriptional regulator